MKAFLADVDALLPPDTGTACAATLEAATLLTAHPQRHHDLFAQAADAIFFFSPDTLQVLEANTAFLRLVDCPASELSTLSVADFCTTSEAEARALLEAIAEGAPVTVERVWQARSGAKRHVHVALSRVRRDGHDLFIAVARDISAQKQTEAELRRSELKYRTLFERANVPTLIFDPADERILEANTEACLTYGFSHDELVGMSLKDLTHDVGRGEEEIRYILATGGSRNFETVHITKEGEHLHMLVSCSVIAYEDRPAVLCFGRNITERQRAEKLLQESEARFRAVVEHASDVIAVLDAQGNFSYISPAVESMLGYPRDAMTQRSALRLMHPDDIGKVLRALALGRRRADMSVAVEFRMRHRDGSWRYLAARGKNLLDLQGVAGILAIVRDVTEMKRYQAELIAARDKAEEMARLKSAFLANMSHEIRTPLTAILGFADVLSEEVEGSQREFVELIREGGRRLSETLNSVLDLARLEASGFTPSLEPTDVNELVQAAVELFGAMAHHRGLALTTQRTALPLWVRADRAGLGRVLNNLLSNALKFTSQGAISVRAWRDDASVCIEVEDTGIGMDASFLPHLFDEFKQESTGLARSHEGTGLGLNITKRLVELMDGTIAVRSEKGKGSCFRLTFPALGPAEVAPAFAPAVSLPELPQHQPSVLVVEDNADTRRLLQRLLQPRYRLTLAAGGDEALRLAQNATFDAILLDINLGDGIDGVELLGRLRRRPALAQVPVVALTAFALPEDRERFLSTGFDQYLAKPFAKSDLLRVLNEAMQAPRLCA